MTDPRGEAEQLRKQFDAIMDRMLGLPDLFDNEELRVMEQVQTILEAPLSATAPIPQGHCSLFVAGGTPCAVAGHCLQSETPAERCKEKLRPSLDAQWCMDAFWRVNPGRNATVPSLYLLDFALEVLRVYGARVSETAPQFQHIGALHRGRTGEAYFVQSVFSIPLPIHGSLEVYMAAADNTKAQEGKDG
jgi:hypothetical protein